MKKNNFFIAIILACILIVGSVTLVVLQPYVKTVYLNGDKSTWSKATYLFGKKLIEEMSNATDNKKPYRVIILWNLKGEVKSIKSIYVNSDGRKKSFVSYFYPGEVIATSNQTLIKQKQNLKRTYNNKLPFKIGDKFIYSDGQGNILFQENYNSNNVYVSDIALYRNNHIDQIKSDTNGDRTFDTWTFYDKGLPAYSEYDSDNDGKPDKKGVYPLDDKYKVTYKMGGAR